MSLLAPLEGQLWKIATGAAGLISLILAGFLVSSYLENRSLTKQKNDLVTQINDPDTGYVAQLAQAHTNVKQVQTAMAEEQASFKAQQSAANAKLAETEATLQRVQAQNKEVNQRLQKFLTTTPQGATHDERMSDIDQSALKDLVQ